MEIRPEFLEVDVKHLTGELRVQRYVQNLLELVTEDGFDAWRVESNCIFKEGTHPHAKFISNTASELTAGYCRVRVEVDILAPNSDSERLEMLGLPVGLEAKLVEGVAAP